MANIIINPWGETPAEKQLRQKGYATTQSGIFETGIQFGAWELRKENAGNALQKIAKALHAIHEHMAMAKWDDERVCITIGIQSRNNWDCVEGEWFEKGTPEWIEAQVKAGVKPKL